MNKIKLAAFVAGATLTAGAVGCTSTNTNNANARNVNSNTAVLTNNNGNANTAGINTINNNANTTTGINTNLSRADYDRDRARYDREAREGRYSGTVGQGAEDGWIHFKTRAALAAADDIRDSTINVDVANNVVTLRGTVANATQRARAEAVARGIDGVRSINNRLTIAGDGTSTTNNANRR